MSKANMLVGLHGAGLTNMMFMPTQSRVLEIRNYGDSHNNCYFTLASEFGHRYFYIQSHGDNGNTQAANFTVDLHALDSVLRVLIKDS
jgi:capsular polysaccharide biosynthesis protein